MDKTRFAAKAFAGTVATTLLVLGSLAGPADAAGGKDTGWGVSGQKDAVVYRGGKDTGWG